MLCISLLFCIMFINETYAKYINSAQGNTNITIARWRIVVNAQDIRSNPEISGTITPVILENEHIKPGVVAPTSEGYFDLMIDASDVDVSFRYTITASIPEDSCVKDLKVTGYSLDDGDFIEIDDDTPITGTFLYSDDIRTANIRMYIKWIDDENQTMDNFEDANATADDNCKGSVNVMLNFIQLQN